MALPEATAHHAKDVLRLRPGTEALAFDGEGREFHATLDEVTKRRVGIRVGAPSDPRPESPLQIALAISALRGDRMELVIQKAVELGVSGIRPFVSVRTDASARPALRGARHDRWAKVVGGAAEQCGRARVPPVEATRPLAEVLSDAEEEVRLVLAERHAEVALAALEPASAGSVLLVVGPPGGFEDRELGQARVAGCRLVGIGPRILRTETAAIAGIAVLQAAWGDLDRGLE